MSIHFISGKPGGGKTLYSVRLLVDELLRGHRPIVTNVPLKLDVLNEYLQKNYPKFFTKWFESNGRIEDGVLHRSSIRGPADAPLQLPPHITDRIRLINDDEVSKFFTFRGNGVNLESVNNAEWKTGKRPDFSKVSDQGVFYVLDEVHIPFNSRAWAETGSEVLYYLSQHRKLGDDLVCITQAIANVDKQFRSVAQDFTYVKNLSKQRAGFFRLPAVFMRNTYAQPATDTSKPMETGSFTLDVKGMASLYDTAKGVGIHGRAGADTKERKKGLHWLWFAIGLPFLLWLGFHYLPVVASHFLSGGKHISLPVHSQSNDVPTVPLSHSRSRSAAVSETVRAYPAETEKTMSVYLGGSSEETNDVVCTGFVILDNAATAYFSDGTTAYSDSGEIQKIERHWVTAFGRRYRIGVGRAVSPPESDEHFAMRSQNETLNQPEAYVSQGQAYERPINDAEILPSINSQASGIPPTPRINGIHNMQGFQPQGQSQLQNYGQ